jgi:eukaryotic-like serine/threonine-protein kinase
MTRTTEDMTREQEQAGDRWRCIKELFAAAVAQPPGDRVAFLTRACAGDDAMGREVQTLLAAHDAAGDLFEHRPAARSVFARLGVLSPQPTRLEPGRRLGPYEIVESIGAGGMGEVYRARDARLDRDVAVKVLPAALVADPGRRRRFVQEARAASALEHPHIAVIHEIGESDGLTFIVMELVRGEPLNAVVSRGPLAVSRAIELAVEIAEALARAHDTGIVHRDLKPANVMVTPDGHAKIIDFGLAKLGSAPDDRTHTVTVAEGLTASGMVVGTPAYMSPEQAQGGTVDYRSDIFTFGVVLQEMLTGAAPFRRRSGVDTMHAILHDPAPRLPDDVDEGADDLQRVIDRCLAKAAADRYQSMRDVAADLQTARRQLDSAELRAVEGRPRLPLRMRVALASAVLLLVAVAVGAGVAARRARSEADRRGTIAQLMHLVDVGRFTDVWRTTRTALQRWPGDLQIQQIAQSVSQTVTLKTDPPGADVAFTAYDDLTGDWISMGQSPLLAVNAPLGMLRWRITKPGFDPLEARFEVGAPAAAAHRPDVDAKPLRLRPTNGEHPGMVFVPGAGELTDFWIDRTEVTNRDFKSFVDRGDYDRRFHDHTGRPGPATWEFGAYPQRQDAYPVNGVSWFEAVAYCRSAGKSLPTVQHWRRAFGAAFFSEVVTVGNFRGRGIEPTDQLRDVGPFGTTGMAGNVKEWVWNEIDGERYVLGGAWNEPVYMSIHDDARPPTDRSEANGFRCVKETAPSGAAVYAAVSDATVWDYAKEKPVDDATFAIFGRLYTYDRFPLEAKTESTQDSAEWRQERVSFAAAYGGERVIADILMPKNTKPPYRTVIWFPGSYALDLSRTDQGVFSYYFDFLPRSGFAVVCPVYKGMYERRVPPGGRSQRRDQIIQWSMDLARTIDYLESRTDFDTHKIAYYGYSMGAARSIAVIAVEPRLKTAMLLSGGLYGDNFLLPEVDPVNFLPRVKIPVLLMDGQYDFTFPLETSQRPFVALLGTPAEHKRHVVFENAGHVPPRVDVIREVLGWLDRYL